MAKKPSTDSDNKVVSLHGDDMRRALSSPEELVEEIAAGRMVILVDDEDRENEGDLVIAGEMADADAVNFMAKFGRGLVCLSLTTERVKELGLSMMALENKAPLETAFTVSIEAREGVTTGISAGDRAQTVAVATPCWPAPVSAMMRFLPMRMASRIWPTVLLILCAPVWLSSSRLK